VWGGILKKAMETRQKAGAGEGYDRLIRVKMTRVAGDLTGSGHITVLIFVFRDNPLKYTDPDGNVPIPAAIYAVASYISVVASSPDTQNDLRFLAEDVAQGDYVSAIFDAVGLIVPGLTNTGAIPKSAEKIVAKFGDDVGKWAAKQLKGMGAQLHHVFTNKNIKGGFTKRFSQVLDGSGLTFNSPEVLVPILGHRGKHSAEYWNKLLVGAETALEGLTKNTSEYRDALKAFLKDETMKIIESPDILKR
jgi:hypothetical protein